MRCAIESFSFNSPVVFAKKNSKRWKNKKFISFSKLFHCSFHEKQFLFYIFLVVRRFSSLTLFIFFSSWTGESDNIFNTCIMSSHLNLFKERRSAFISFIFYKEEFLNIFWKEDGDFYFLGRCNWAVWSLNFFI